VLAALLYSFLTKRQDKTNTLNTILSLACLVCDWFSSEV
jgi:hypothetical protein